MKRQRLLFSVCFLLCIGLAVLFGAPMAENTYQRIQNMDFTAQSVETIIQTYDDLYTHITKIAENAREDMIEARQLGNREAYQEAYNRYVNLAKYDMTQEQTDRLLERILEEPAEKQLQYALWLYGRSRYYRPTLNIDFSQSGEGYSYCYIQRMQQPPHSKIVLPNAFQIRFDVSKTGMLAGWGTTPDSVDYSPGETITMPIANQTLYAIWVNAVQFSDSFTDTEILHQDVTIGDKISVPKVMPPDPTYRFLGWYDQNTGLLVNDESTYEVTGKGAIFQGLWKNLTVGAITPLYYGFDRLPTKTQIKMGFSVSNQGNTPLRQLKATLSTESPSVKFIKDTLALGDIPAGMHRTNNGRYVTRSQSVISGESNTFRFVIDELPSGTRVPFTLSITESDGETWTSPVTFTVR